MDDGKGGDNDENDEYLAQYVESIEQAMEDKVREVARQAKPV